MELPVELPPTLLAVSSSRTEGELPEGVVPA
jgi:hypothetical protein